MDGKTVRGARNPDGSRVHLLAALAGVRVLSQPRPRPARKPQIPMIIPLLGGLDLDGAVITADALHTQRATASYVHGRGADFAFPVKDNQPGLSDALDALPWHNVPVTHATADRGHGRIETRTIQVLDAPGDLPFPHVRQAYLIERHVTATDGTPLSDIAALGVTSLGATRASPQTIAGIVRGHWAIENKIHWVRHPLPRRPVSGPHPLRATGHGHASPSEPSTWPDATTPPKPPAGPAAPWSGPSPSSDSHHDLGTAVRKRLAKAEVKLEQTRAALDIMGKAFALLELLSESADSPKPSAR